MWSKESFDLSNLVVQVEKSNEISDRDGCHPMRNGFIETSGSSYPQTMHDLIQSSKHNSTILESSWAH